MLVVGVPKEDPDVRARLPIGGIVHEETYPRVSDEELLEFYRDREVEGWDRYMSYADMADAMRESGVENLAQVYTILKYTRETNERFRFLLDLWRSGNPKSTSDTVAGARRALYLTQRCKGPQRFAKKKENNEEIGA